MRKFTECSNMIITATENYQKKDSLKLDNPRTSQSSPVKIFSTLTFFFSKTEKQKFESEQSKLLG